MRRYWIPISPAMQLDENPVRKVRVLGEDLVLFRSERGQLGRDWERCLRSRVNLQFGLRDEDGLRCIYHGWQHAPDGRCIDAPLEDPTKRFKDQLKLTAYPVEALGGLILAYLGPLHAL